jgi:hypothetical protein
MHFVTSITIPYLGTGVNLLFYDFFKYGLTISASDKTPGMIVYHTTPSGCMPNQDRNSSGFRLSYYKSSGCTMPVLYGDPTIKKPNWRSIFSGFSPTFVLAHFFNHIVTALPIPLLPWIRDEFALTNTQGGTGSYSLHIIDGTCPIAVRSACRPYWT